MGEVAERVGERAHPAVALPGDVRPRPREVVHLVVAQRRDATVGPWVEPGEHGHPRVHRDPGGPGAGDQVGEALQRGDVLDRRLVVAPVVQRLVHRPDATLDRHRDVDRVDHRGHGARDRVRRAHPAGADVAVGGAVRRTAAVEVDLVVAALLHGPPRDRSEQGRVGPAELDAHRPVRSARQDLVAVPVVQRPDVDHLGDQERVPRQPAQQLAVGRERALHHRCDHEPVVRYGIVLPRHPASVTDTRGPVRVGVR